MKLFRENLDRKFQEMKSPYVTIQTIQTIQTKFRQKIPGNEKPLWDYLENLDHLEKIQTENFRK